MSMGMGVSDPLVKRSTGVSIWWSFILIVVGLMAIAMPLVAGVTVGLLVGWVVLLAGIVQIVVAYGHRRLRSALPKFLIGLFYAMFGFYALLFPFATLATLTLALAIFFIVEGVFELVAYFLIRSIPGASWLILDGIVALVLGGLIAASWPSGAVWAIGTLMGINFLITGFTRLMISLAHRSGTA